MKCWQGPGFSFSKALGNFPFNSPPAIFLTISDSALKEILAGIRIYLKQWQGPELVEIMTGVRFLLTYL